MNVLQVQDHSSRFVYNNIDREMISLPHRYLVYISAQNAFHMLSSDPFKIYISVTRVKRHDDHQIPATFWGGSHSGMLS